jgi:uncharacterized protein YnzC (UPF0291/DUF896 family)
MTQQKYYKKINKSIKRINNYKEKKPDKLLQCEWESEQSIIRFPYIANITHIGFTPEFITHINEMKYFLWGKCSIKREHQYNKRCNQDGYIRKSIKNRNIEVLDEVTNYKIKIRISGSKNIFNNNIIIIENKNVYEKIIPLKNHIKTDEFTIVLKNFNERYRRDYTECKKTYMTHYSEINFYGNILKDSKSSESEDDCCNFNHYDFQCPYSKYNRFLLSKKHKKEIKKKRYKKYKLKKNKYYYNEINDFKIY